MEAEEIRDKIKDILEEGESELTDWERNFINDIEKKLDERQILSPRTCDIVTQIYDKIFDH